MNRVIGHTLVFLHLITRHSRQKQKHFQPKLAMPAMKKLLQTILCSHNIIQYYAKAKGLEKKALVV